MKGPAHGLGILAFALLSVLQVALGIAVYLGVDRFLAAFLTSLVTGLGIYLARLEASLPTFSSLRQFAASGRPTWPLRLTYAGMGAISTLFGAVFQELYPWVLDTAFEILRRLNRMATPGELLPEAILDIFLALFSMRTLALMAVSAFLLFLRDAYRRFLLERGPVHRLKMMYHRHAARYRLERDEEVLRMLCFGSGLAVALGLNVLFLLMLALGSRRHLTAEAALAPQSSPEERRSSRRAYSIYQQAIFAAALWLPLLDQDNADHRLFAALIFTPALVAVASRFVAPGSLVSRQLAAPLIVSLAVAGPIVAGATQVAEPSINPLVTFVLSHSRWIPADYQRHLATFISWVVMAGFTQLAVAFAFDERRAGFRRQDPILLYRLHKLQIFIMSVVFRAPMILLMADALPAGAEPDLDLLRSLTGFILFMGLSTLIEESDMRRVPERLAREHSSYSRERGLKTWGRRLELELNARDAVNLVSIVTATVVLLVAGEGVLQLAAPLIALVIVSAYVAFVHDEAVIGKESLGFERSFGKGVWKRWIRGGGRPSAGDR